MEPGFSWSRFFNFEGLVSQSAWFSGRSELIMGTLVVHALCAFVLIAIPVFFIFKKLGSQNSSLKGFWSLGFFSLVLGLWHGVSALNVLMPLYPIEVLAGAVAGLFGLMALIFFTSYFRRASDLQERLQLLYDRDAAVSKMEKKSKELDKRSLQWKKQHDNLLTSEKELRERVELLEAIKDKLGGMLKLSSKEIEQYENRFEEWRKMRGKDHEMLEFVTTEIMRKETDWQEKVRQTELELTEARARMSQEQKRIEFYEQKLLELEKQKQSNLLMESEGPDVELEDLGDSTFSMDLVAEVSKLCKEAEGFDETRNKTLSIEKSLPAEPFLVGQEGKLIRRCVASFIKYAIAKSPDSDGMVDVSLVPASDQLQINISIMGFGLQPTSSLFRIFKRTGMSAPPQNFKLDAPLADGKRCIDRIGSGTIWLESDESIGSVFHIEIPREALTKFEKAAEEKAPAAAS